LNGPADENPDNKEYQRQMIVIFFDDYKNGALTVMLADVLQLWVRT